MEFKGICASEGPWAWLFVTVSVHCSSASPQALAELAFVAPDGYVLSLCHVLTYSFLLKSLLSLEK